MKFLKASAGGNRGYLDLLVLKHKLLKYCLFEDLPARTRDNHLITKVRETMASVESYRMCMCPYPDGDDDVDVMWKANLPASLKKARFLYESLIYGQDFDPQLRFCVHSLRHVDSHPHP